MALLDRVVCLTRSHPRGATRGWGPWPLENLIPEKSHPVISQPGCRQGRGYRDSGIIARCFHAGRSRRSVLNLHELTAGEHFTAARKVWIPVLPRLSEVNRRQVTGKSVFEDRRFSNRADHWGGRRTINRSSISPRLIRLSCRFRCFVGSHGSPSSSSSASSSNFSSITYSARGCGIT
jgi:hypothetical protein